MQRYFLTRHVFLCLTEDHAVLLDLQRDKYIGVTPAQMNAMAMAIEGWPDDPFATKDPNKYPPEQEILQTMLETKMLTTDPSQGKPVQLLQLPWPQNTLTHDELEQRPRVRAAHVLQVITAAAKVRAGLKWRPIEKVVAGVHQRKLRHTASSSAFDLVRAAPLVEAYLYLRPLFFSSKDNCLFDSLALVEFLAHYGLFPTWTIGLKTGPFLAHSWVHEGDVIFNDTPDYVRRFTPILAI